MGRNRVQGRKRLTFFTGCTERPNLSLCIADAIIYSLPVWLESSFGEFPCSH